MWETKNKINTRLSIEKQFPNLNILVLNDRIGLVEQLRDELVHGSINESEQTIKQPILSQEFINKFSVKTYHSKADNDPELEYEYSGTQDLEINQDQNTQANESMHFATLQTAKTTQAHAAI
jgi:hypothetical protein